MDSPVMLVDSFAQIYRCFHAVKALSNSAGAPTNAVFGIAKFLIRLDREHKSPFGAFVYDKGKPAFRMELAPDYKANRPPMPPEMSLQIPYIRRLVRAFGWIEVEHDGCEADDLLASIAGALAPEKVVIVSGDKDLSQVIDSRVTMLVPDPAGGLRLRGPAEVAEKFGVPPERIVDYLALLGDASDNIPGVNGVGAKTAAKLLSEFGSGTAVFDNAAKVKSESLRAKLESSRELFLKNVKLVELHRNPPEGVVWKLENFRRPEPDWNAVREICRELELRSILKELPDDSGSLFAPQKPPEPPKTDSFSQQNLF